MIQKPAVFTQIKSFILNFYQNKLGSITDETPFLVSFCESLELVFRLGLKNHYHLLRRQDYWNWMKCLVRICDESNIFVHPAFSRSINSIQNNRGIKTVQGRGRLLIRMLLQHGIIDWPMKLLVEHLSHLGARFYDPNNSIIGSEILIQVFCSLTSEISRIPFNLILENTEFLDDTWILPVFKKLEFVPCKILGVRVETVDGHCIVAEIDPNGVAAEDNQISIGDILSTMYGHTLHNAGFHLNSLRASHGGEPVPVGVTKALMPDGRIYPRLKFLLEQHGYSNLLGKIQMTENDYLTNLNQSQFFRERPWCRICYVGQCDVGADGSVHVINKSILNVLVNLKENEELLPVYIDLGELGITVWRLKPSGELDRSSGPLFRHSYPQVSSCGRRTDDTNYFAYIAGSESCTIAKNFTCYVFEAVNKDEAKELISGLSLGFDRTHWTL